MGAQEGCGGGGARGRPVEREAPIAGPATLSYHLSARRYESMRAAGLAQTHRRGQARGRRQAYLKAHVKTSCKRTYANFNLAAAPSSYEGANPP